MNWVFATASFSAICSACMLTYIKSLFHLECSDYNSRQDFGENNNLAITASVLFAVLATMANAAFLIFGSRSKRGLALAAALFSKWQPSFYGIISAEKFVVVALVMDGALRNEVFDSCIVASYRDKIFAAQALTTAALTLNGFSAICCDLDASITPPLRRFAYFISISCIVLDGLGSYVWGNAISSNSSLSIGPFKFVLDNQITSCITSQVFIAFHMFYVACRSPNGRGWAYASLRFELNESEATMSAPLMPASFQKLELVPKSNGTRHRRLSQFFGAWSKFRLRLAAHQERIVKSSCVFSIPCVARGVNMSSQSEHGLARPLFKFSFLKPLQQLAEAHPAAYLCFFMFFILGSFVCSSVLEDPGLATVPLNSFVLVGMLGCFSCRRHNFDVVACKHVVTSFRFVFFVSLLFTWILIDIRRSYFRIQNFTPLATVGVVIAILILIIAVITDCSPRVSATMQVYMSVRKNVFLVDSQFL